MDSPYSSYRAIRAQRTWRPLGKMSWWRIVLGSALLLSVFLISGFFSQRLALNGHFKAAEKLMVSPRWVERYNPTLKAFIEAGVLYQDGDYEAARDAFAAIEENEAAASMKNVSAVKLAAQALQGGDEETARAVLEDVDASLLPKESGAGYAALLAQLELP